MNNVYQYGDKLLGTVKAIREYNDKLLEEKAIDSETWEELEKEIKDLDHNTMIVIDLEFGMGIYYEEYDCIFKEGVIL